MADGVRLLKQIIAMVKTNESVVGSGVKVTRYDNEPA